MTNIVYPLPYIYYSLCLCGVKEQVGQVQGQNRERQRNHQRSTTAFCSIAHKNCVIFVFIFVVMLTAYTMKTTT